MIGFKVIVTGSTKMNKAEWQSDKSKSFDLDRSGIEPWHSQFQSLRSWAHSFMCLSLIILFSQSVNTEKNSTFFTQLF